MKMQINTNDKNWFKSLLQLLKKREEYVLIDDGNLGLNMEDFKNGFKLLKKINETMGLNWKEIFQIITGIGMGGTGLWLVRLAILDPEPTSKLGLLIGSGVFLIAGGSYAILRVFGSEWKVSMNVKGGFTIMPI